MNQMIMNRKQNRTKSKKHDVKIEKSDFVIKREKIDDANKSATIESTTNRDSIVKNTKPPLDIQVSVTKDNDGATSKRKIVIKSLVNSTVYQDTLKEVKQKEQVKLKEKEKEKEREKEREKAKERERDRDRNRDKQKHSSGQSKSHNKDHRKQRSRSSSSLSDEETYLRERERYRVSFSTEFWLIIKTII